MDPRTPVLVGVGTSSADAEAAELMALAAEAAGADAGSRRILAAVERIVVPRGTWSYSDPARIVAERIGAGSPRTVLVELGIPQQTPINQALAAITAGELEVALIVGAEARARAARASTGTGARASTAADASGLRTVLRRDQPTGEGAHETDQAGAQPDELQRPSGIIVAPAEVEAALYAPVEQYALIESALRAADGVSVDAHRRQVAALWARFNQVARDNPEAAFPAPMDATAIETFGPHNRPLAFPYGKWHASQWTVDQGAALLLCSAGAARRLGVPRDRWIFARAGLESSFELPLVNRGQLHRWPAMRVLGRAAARRIGRPLNECEHVELYSCFPAAVRVQQHELGFPATGTPTVTGGMTFAGGPFNNFVLNATAAMVNRLRGTAPALGLVTTVSGLLTKPGLAVWASEPDGDGCLVADLAADAAGATETVEACLHHDGTAVVAACTLTYDGLAPRDLIAVLDTPAGERVIARSRHPGLLDQATHTELIGRTVVVEGNSLAV